MQQQQQQPDQHYDQQDINNAPINIQYQSFDPDSSKYITEMKSIQPFSTKDEYLYAMKEDLGEWFNSMYQTKIRADFFIQELENGVLICQHANNVMRAASKHCKFNLSDLNAAGIINAIQLALPDNSNKNNLNTNNALKNLLLTPNGKSSSWIGDYLLYKPSAKPQSFQARDNICNFIKWCRHIARVRECLMFETDDLILRKNENNVILCLLEVARFGSKFGIEVPTIIKLEQEIEAEIQRETLSKTVKQIIPIVPDTTDSITIETDVNSNQPEIDEEESLKKSIVINIISPKSLSGSFVGSRAVLGDEEGNDNLDKEELKQDVIFVEKNDNEISVYVDNDDEFKNNEDKLREVIQQIMTNSSLDRGEADTNNDITDITEMSEQSSTRPTTVHSSIDLKSSQSQQLSLSKTLILIKSDHSSNLDRLDHEKTANNEEILLDLNSNNSSVIYHHNDNDDDSLNNVDIKNSEKIESDDLDAKSNSLNDSLEELNDEDSSNKKLENNLINNNQNTNSNLTTSSISSISSLSSNSNKKQAQDNCELDGFQQLEINEPAKSPILNTEAIQSTNLAVDYTSNSNSSSPLLTSPVSSASSAALSTDAAQSNFNKSPTIEKVNQQINKTSEVKLNNQLPPIQAAEQRRTFRQPIKNLNNLYFSNSTTSAYPSKTNTPRNNSKQSHVRSRSNSYDALNNNTLSSDQAASNNSLNQSQSNLHKHVCSIANRCTCTKKFLVDKIGEGKYKIGNTNNIVFIRVMFFLIFTGLEFFLIFLN